MHRAAAGLILIAWLLAPPVEAQQPGAAERREAKALHDEAQRDYQQGRLDDAIQKFARAYELVRDPVLLYNIAQAHRRRSDRVQAIVNYQRFLAELGDASERDGIKVEGVRLRIEELKQELALAHPLPAMAAGGGAPAANMASKPANKPASKPASTVTAAPAARPAPAVVTGSQSARLFVEADFGLSRIAVPAPDDRPWDQPTAPTLRIGLGRAWPGLAGRLGAGLAAQGTVVPYWDQQTLARRRSLLGALLVTGGSRAALGRLGLGVELGLGAAFWAGLGPGNPLSHRSEGLVVLPLGEIGWSASFDVGARTWLRLRPSYALLRGRGRLEPVAPWIHQFQIQIGTGYAIR